MELDLHYLKLFNVLAAELSFSKAAHILYISQPALSMQIKKMEKEMGFKLFAKSGKSVYLTENGKTLYEYTKKIFSLVEEAEACLYKKNTNVSGTITIGASNTPGTYILPRILGEFMEKYPQVNSSLHIASTFEIERLIFENKIDFAVNGGDIPYSNQIYVEKLAEDEMIFIASPFSAFAEKEFAEPHELAGSRFIAHENNSQLYRMAVSILESLDIPINITMSLGNIDAIKQAVSANLGISAVPRSAACVELNRRTLRQIILKGQRWVYPYNLIYYRNRHHSNAARGLMDMVRERMGNLMEYQR